MSDFIYCLNSSTIKPTPILEKIRIASKAGYQAIELWHDDIDLYLAEGGTLNDIRHALEDAGLIVPTTIFLKGWWDTTGEEYVQKMDEIKRRLHQAAEVGAPFSIAGPPHGEVDYNVGAEQYSRLLNVGLEFGVRPVFEYLGFSQMVNTIDIALEIITRSEHPAASIVVDPFHCYRGGGGIESLAKLQESQIAISHFNDAPADPPWDQQGDPDRVMPGDGVIDLKRYIELLRKTGYQRSVSLELFREDLWQSDAEEVANIGMEKMKQYLEV